MKNRNIPYGYKYENGQKVIQENEAELIRKMYQDYRNGKSLGYIASELENISAEYREGVCAWNKSRVRRILSDVRYTGAKDFPKLIENKMFDEVQRKIETANMQCKADRSADIYQIHNVYCKLCGQRMKRRTSYSGNRYEKWVCQNADCHIIAEKADTKLLDELTECLNGLIQNPDKIRYEEKNDMGKSVKHFPIIQTPASEKEVEERYKLPIMQVAEAYRRLDTDEYITKRLRADFRKYKILSAFSCELFERTVKKIYMKSNGSISLMLKNGQLIGGMDDEQH